MKHPFWADPNSSIAILEPTDEAIDKYGHGCGSDFIRLSSEHMRALQDGKVLAWNDSEYSTLVIFVDAFKKWKVEHE